MCVTSSSNGTVLATQPTAPAATAAAMCGSSLLRELAEHTTATVEIYLYDILPTWRVIALDETLFVSSFGNDIEGHTSPMYKISSAAHGGAMHRGFRRFVGELQRTAQRVM